jgi:hypothetical protein
VSSRPWRGDWAELDIGGIKSCAVSLLAPENLKNVTEADAKELTALYEKLLVIQQRVVSGVRSPK